MTRKRRPVGGLELLPAAEAAPILVIHRAKDLKKWLARAAKDPSYASPDQVARYRLELEAINKINRLSRADRPNNTSFQAPG